MNNEAPEQDREISVWHKGEKLVPESKLLELQQRISQLEQERKEIASDAFKAGMDYGYNSSRPNLQQYLSQFDQTKTEGV